MLKKITWEEFTAFRKSLRFKNAHYAIENSPFAEFEWASQKLNITPQEYLITLLHKHLYNINILIAKKDKSFNYYLFTELASALDYLDLWDYMNKECEKEPDLRASEYREKLMNTFHKFTKITYKPKEV